MSITPGTRAPGTERSWRLATCRAGSVASKACGGSTRNAFSAPASTCATSGLLQGVSQATAIIARATRHDSGLPNGHST